MLDSNGLMDHPSRHIVEKNTDDNDLTDHPTNPNRGKNADSNGLTDPSDTASIFYLLIVKSSKSSISIIVMQSELPIVNLLFMFFH
jgi:hypothetical protein